MSAIEGLIGEFGRSPGNGRKTAQRLTYYLLKGRPEDASRLSAAIDRVVAEVRPCGECGNLSSEAPCEYCRNSRRDASQICVVEEASDIAAIEASGRFRGRYHVLGGHLSPLDGVGPDELRIAELETRLKSGEVGEVILATNPNAEGDATAHHISSLLAGSGVKFSRIACGMPLGGDLEYADHVTIGRSLENRGPV